MNAKQRGLVFVCAFVSVLFLHGTRAPQAQEAAPAVVVKSLQETKFEAVAGLPACLTASAQQGDPSKGPSTLLARTTQGCLIPWHWHTPNEQVIQVRGVARVQMKGGEPVTVRAGAYAFLPSRHIHKYFCSSGPCIFFVLSDAPFDIYYVNEAGEEIPPEEALKAAPKPTGNPR